MTADVPKICRDLQALQRQRAVVIKSRIMQQNRLTAVIAGTLGYSSGLPEKERRAKFDEADKLISSVVKSNNPDAHPMGRVILSTEMGIDAFDHLCGKIEGEMKELARLLPVIEWVRHPDRRGFGELFLAIVVGECGDLSGYANPGKVWRRLGCAPWSFGGKTLMGATWRGGKDGKLPASEWEAFGYSPRRRSIAFLIGKNIVMQNGPGPYRRRYEEVKAAYPGLHPDRVRCKDCGGSKKTTRGGACANCKGSGVVMKRADQHAMLLATKRLLRDLWREWNGQGGGVGGNATEDSFAAALPT